MNGLRKKERPRKGIKRGLNQANKGRERLLNIATTRLTMALERRKGRERLSNVVTTRLTMAIERKKG